MTNNSIGTMTPTEGFSDKLDILRHVSDIKLRLKNDITNDFVLARLGDKDKEFIIEMTGNAYFSKRLLEILKEKSEYYKWDSESESYIKKTIEGEDKEKIDKIAKSVFDSYMIRIYMTVILNRNVDKNYLINILSGYVHQEGEDDKEIDRDKMGAYVKSLLADEGKKGGK